MGKLVGVDWFLGLEMKFIGEVMGLDWDFFRVLFKVFMVVDISLKSGMGILFSIVDQNKVEFLLLIWQLLQVGCQFYVIEGMVVMIEVIGMLVIIVIKRIGEGYFDVVDVVVDGMVKVVVNIFLGDMFVLRDGFYIWCAVVEWCIFCFILLDIVRVVVESLFVEDGSYSIQIMVEYLVGS